MLKKKWKKREERHCNPLSDTKTQNKPIVNMLRLNVKIIAMAEHKYSFKKFLLEYGYFTMLC